MNHTLTDRQIKYVAARAKGMGRNEACLEAGYSDKVKPHQVENTKAVKKAIVTALEDKGVGDDYLAMQLKDGSEATKTVVVTNKGSVTKKVVLPDFENRHKFVKTILELRGDLTESNEINMNLGVIHIPQIMNGTAWDDQSDTRGSGQSDNNTQSGQAIPDNT